ncbi:hypothetical protein PP935_gp013 [Rhizobium phage RHph_N34]|uniref:Uncharacterized protein n=1 Tax=Rhizobium phage RHph_N34 TaxID=2509586 RepID=A0A7S5UXW4_9CAUD|nr:hypothetical protein PP935_gp013 [Rhizobium phage RHph_N34]QIG73788.1 hypothetical protein EVC06_013 [Rhizobium phage RHph_N34]
MRPVAIVREDNNYVRDLSSNAVLSKDRNGYEQRLRAKRNQIEKNNLEKTVEDLIRRVAALEERLASKNG